MTLSRKERAEALFLGKEAARTAGFAKRVSVKTKKPVVVAAILSTGAAYTWGIPEARTQIAAQLSAAQRKEFWREVRTRFERINASKIERDDENLERNRTAYTMRVWNASFSPKSKLGESEEEWLWKDFASKSGLTAEGRALGSALVNTAADWMKAGRLEWFIHTAYADAPSVSEYYAETAIPRVEETAKKISERLMKFTRNATVIFVDASAANPAPASFRTVERAADSRGTKIAVFPTTTMPGNLSPLNMPALNHFSMNMLGTWRGWQGKKIILLNPATLRLALYDGRIHEMAFHDDKKIRGFYRPHDSFGEITYPSIPDPHKWAQEFEDVVKKSARTRFLRG